MSTASSDEFVELGADAQRGNLLGIQPVVSDRDYASDESFYSKLDSYLRQAAERGWLGPRTIVVWPEYVGVWLASTGERAAATLAGTMQNVALAHLPRFAAALLTSREKNRLNAAIFRTQAASMARRYQAAFSRLAREHAVTVVGGSILLPAPSVQAGQVTAGQGSLQSVSAVFQPDGAAYPHLVRKAFPTAGEQPFVSAAPVADTRVFETPAGRLGVLVCADAWYPEPYAALQAAGAELVAVPSFIEAPGLWDKPWGGYSGHAAPAGVDLNDVGRLTEGQARRKYSLAGRLAESGARYGLDIYLRGNFWDIVADSGTAVAVRDGQVREAGRAGGALLNLWL
jgi:carbon-nitrogen hydrolase